MTEHLEQIAKKVKRLKDEYKAVVDRNTMLIQENNKVKTEITTLTDRLKALEQHRKLALASEVIDVSDEEKKEIKRLLNHYVKEIDTCISILSD